MNNTERVERNPKAMTDCYTSAHEARSGPGDARSTARQIDQDEQLEGQLTCKVILITGCSSRIGLETACALSFHRSYTLRHRMQLAKGKPGARGPRAQSPRAHLLQLDLESLVSAKACAAEFLSKSQRLDILICNAGIMAVPEGRTQDGFERDFGVNHLTHFLLFNFLQPALLKSTTPERTSRVAILSSQTHRIGQVDFEDINHEQYYDLTAAYGASKIANVWTFNEIERRYGHLGIHSLSVHPGFTQTDLGRHLSEEQLASIASDPYALATLKSTEQGTTTSVCAAVASELEGRGGRFLEDCQIAEPMNPDAHYLAAGHGMQAYDERQAVKLWDIPIGLVRSYLGK